MGLIMYKNNNKAIVAHLGRRRNYAEAVALAKRGELERLYTDSYINPDSEFFALLHSVSQRNFGVVSKEVAKFIIKSCKQLDRNKVCSNNLFGLAYKMESNLAKSDLALSKVHSAYGRKFGKWVAGNGFGEAIALYSVYGSAFSLFEMAKKQALRCVLDFFIAPLKTEQALISNEFDKWQGWEDVRRYDMERVDFVSKREKKEIQLADIVLAPSEFVWKELIKIGVTENKVKILPYVNMGISELYTKPRIRHYDENRKLRCLFVGTAGLRKGIPYFLEAIYSLKKKVEAKVVGPVSVNKSVLGKYADCCDFTGRVPGNEVFRYFDWADIFIFPSICEGMAMVNVEAQSTGLPVITTQNAGSLVKDSVTGFIVPHGKTEPVIEAIEKFLINPDLVKTMSENTLYQKQRGLNEYGDELSKVLFSEK